MEYEKIVGTIKDLQVGDLFIKGRYDRLHRDYSLQHTHQVIDVAPLVHIRYNEIDMQSPRKYLTKAGILDHILIWRPIANKGWSFEEAKKHTVRERLLERCAAYAGLPCDRRGIEDTEWCERCLAARDLENYEQAVFFIREDYASMDRRGWGSRPGFPEGCHTQAKIDLQRFDRLFTGTRGVSKETAAKLMVSLETELDDVVDSGQVIQYTEGNAPTFFQPAQQYRHTIQFKDGSYDDAVGVHCKVDPDTGAVDVFDTWVAAEECNSSFHVAPGEWRSVRSHKVEDS